MHKGTWALRNFVLTTEPWMGFSISWHTTCRKHWGTKSGIHKSHLLGSPIWLAGNIAEVYVAMVQKLGQCSGTLLQNTMSRKGILFFTSFLEPPILMVWEMPQGLRSRLQIPPPSRKLLPMYLRNMFWPPSHCGICCSMSFLLVWVFFAWHTWMFVGARLEE